MTSKILKSRFKAVCTACKRFLAVGTRIYWTPTATYCLDCGDSNPEVAEQQLQANSGDTTAAPAGDDAELFCP